MKMLLTCSLAVVLLTGPAFAQSSGESTTGLSTFNPLSNPANTGTVSDGTAGKKRQPTQRSLSAAEGTVGSAGQSAGDTPLDRENRRLDKAIGNICRGC